MNKRVVIGELAGLFWLAGDAAWAIGDRMKIENTQLMAFCFVMALAFGGYFVVMQFLDLLEQRSKEQQAHASAEQGTPE